MRNDNNWHEVTSRSLTKKYGNYLDKKEVVSIIKNSKNDSESHHKAYNKAYERYAEQYTLQLKNILVHLSTVYALYEKVPVQPPCPTLEFVPTDVSNKIKSTVVRETVGAVSRGIRNLGGRAVRYVTEPIGKLIPQTSTTQSNKLTKNQRMQLNQATIQLGSRRSSRVRQRPMALRNYKTEW